MILLIGITYTKGVIIPIYIILGLWVKRSIINKLEMKYSEEINIVRLKRVIAVGSQYLITLPMLTISMIPWMYSLNIIYVPRYDLFFSYIIISYIITKLILFIIKGEKCFFLIIISLMINLFIALEYSPHMMKEINVYQDEYTSTD
jgi:hypothetical protein